MTGILTIAPSSIDRLKQAIRKITKRNRGTSLDQIIDELRLKLPGWIRYFRLAKMKITLANLDGWIRRKVRCYKLKQLKTPYTMVKFFKVQGVPTWNAWRGALSGKGWWRKAAMPQMNMAMSNEWLKEKGLPSLLEIYLSL
jgi:RNA-directed DNA polymerase